MTESTNSDVTIPWDEYQWLINAVFWLTDGHWTVEINEAAKLLKEGPVTLRGGSVDGDKKERYQARAQEKLTKFAVLQAKLCKQFYTTNKYYQTYRQRKDTK